MSHSFVILLHTDEKKAHLDLLMERQPGGPLASWRLLETPVTPDTPVAPELLDVLDSLEQGLHGLPAESQPDHRREYLTYEGPVSGGRGRVQRIDGGTVVFQTQDPDRITFTLAGECLQGQFILRHIEGEHWELRRGDGTGMSHECNR